MQKLDDCQIVISESPDSTAEWCKTHRLDVLLREVKKFSPWMFNEAVTTYEQFAAAMTANEQRREAERLPALGQPEWIAEKRIVGTKEGAETAKSQLLLIVWCYRRFSSSLSSLFIAAFIVTSNACRLCFYCRLLLAKVSMASTIGQTVYQIVE